MRVEVWLVGTHTQRCPPSRAHLQSALRLSSPRSCHVLNCYPWTRDELFSSLTPLSLPVTCVTQCEERSSLYGFRALMDIGCNHLDLDILLLLLRDLTAAVPALAVLVLLETHVINAPALKLEAHVVEAAATLLAPPLYEDILLLPVADVIERTEDVLQMYLHRWHMTTEWDYAQCLVGRAWLLNGYIHVLPLNEEDSIKVLHTTDSDTVICRAVQLLSSPKLHKEVELSRALWQWLDDTVEPLMRTDTFHSTIIAAPPVIAVFLSRLPRKVLHECILFATIDRPLTSVMSSGRATTVHKQHECPYQLLPAFQDSVTSWCSDEAGRLSDEQRQQICMEEVFQLETVVTEFETAIRNRRLVRVPLRHMSRYIFLRLVCMDFPLTPMHELAHLHHVAALQCQGENGDDGKEDNAITPPTDEELILSLKLTWCLQRWQSYLMDGKRRASASTAHMRMSEGDKQRYEHLLHVRGWRRDAERCVDEFCHGGMEGVEAVTPSGGALRKLEKQLFSPFRLPYRGDSIDWISRYINDVARGSKPETDRPKGKCLRSARQSPVGSEHSHIPENLENILVRFDARMCSDARAFCEPNDDDASSESALSTVSTSSTGMFEAEELLLEMESVEELVAQELQLEHPSHNPSTDDPGGARAAMNIVGNQLFMQTAQLIGNELNL